MGKRKESKLSQGQRAFFKWAEFSLLLLPPPPKSSKVFLEGRFETTPDTNNLVCPLGFHVDYAGKKLLLCPNNENRSVYLSHKREIE